MYVNVCGFTKSRYKTKPNKTKAKQKQKQNPPSVRSNTRTDKHHKRTTVSLSASLEEHVSHAHFSTNHCNEPHPAKARRGMKQKNRVAGSHKR